MIPEDAARAASAAMNCRWTPRSGRHPDCELCLAAARAALEAAAPHIRAQALLEAADELDLPGTNTTGYYSSECQSGYVEAEGDAIDWLRARAVTERGGDG